MCSRNGNDRMGYLCAMKYSPLAKSDQMQGVEGNPIKEI